MSWRAVGTAVELLLIVVVASLLVGQVLGQPVLLSFVTSGSMEPALDEGDGFVAIPSALVSEFEVGDVVVFRAEAIQGSGLTTHRIVDQTDRGYVTKGDANPFTDQDSGEPPVKAAQIVAVAWSPGGEVLVIPALGTLVTTIQSVLQTIQTRLAALLRTRALLGTQGIAYLILTISVLLYGFDFWRDRTSRTRDRSRDSGTNVRTILAVLAILLVVAATASMLLPSGTHRFEVVSAEFDSPGPRVITVGETETVTFEVPNSGVVPVFVFLEPASEGIEVADRELRVGSRDLRTTEVALSAADETGYHRRFLVERRYLAVLPRGTIQALHGFHPWAPVIVIDALLGGAFYLLGAALVEGGRIRLRKRERGGPIRRRIGWVFR